MKLTNNIPFFYATIPCERERRNLGFNVLCSGYTHYKTIKSILQQGLEYAPLPVQEAFDALTETYTGNGRFCRDTSTLLQ